MVRPPAREEALGLTTYLTDVPGIGGRLRAEAEDFQVIELGDGPPEAPDGAYAAARIRLRNWETNRFVGKAARELGIKRGHVSFSGMKDKRAVTEQWFTFRCPVGKVPDLERLQDVQVLEAHATNHRTYAGAHAGNRFVLRVRGHDGTKDQVDRILDRIRAEGGVPQYFGPQRFGAYWRPVTHRVGAAIVADDLEEAVRRYLGDPCPEEDPTVQAARAHWDATRDPETTLELFPPRLDPERDLLKRLRKRPQDWRGALKALPHNLLQLFIHAHQSWIFNHVLSARLDAGLGLRAAHVGDRVMALDDDGTRTHLVTSRNRDRVQKELDRGRAVLTAPLVGTDTPMAEGGPGDVEAAVLERFHVDPAAFRCSALPEVASSGRRRGILQPVRDLEAVWVDGDPVVSFSLGRGAYATVVMREVMKADLDAY